MSLPPGFEPEAVRRPDSPEGVAAALEEARAAGRTVVPVGAGGRTGPLPPDGPFEVLSLEALAGVEEHEPGDLTFTARPGTTLEGLDEVLAPHGQWLPVDPPGAPGRTLGGVVATGLGGSLHAGYGAVRDQVLGLSLVTGDGRLLRLGGRVMKNVAGFDLVRLAVGSRGALGVVVSVSMRVFPRPRATRVLVLDGPDEVVLAAALAVATAPVVPAGATVVGAPGGARLVVALHGPEAALDADRRTLEEAGGGTFTPADDGGSLLGAARDAGAEGALAFRQGGLPSEVARRWAALRAAEPGLALQADPLSGVVRGSLPEAGPDALGRLRAAGEALGRPLLFTALDPRLHAAARPWTGDPAGGLADELRRRFDPDGVLTPGRLAR